MAEEKESKIPLPTCKRTLVRWNPNSSVFQKK